MSFCIMFPFLLLCYSQSQFLTLFIPYSFLHWTLKCHNNMIIYNRDTFKVIKDTLENWINLLQGGNFADDEEKFPAGKYGEIKKRVWDLFEKPHTSIGARIIAVFSVLCIIISTIILTLNTLPIFLNSPDKILGDYWIFAIIEMVYMSWFTIEFFVRWDIYFQLLTIIQ